MSCQRCGGRMVETMAYDEEGRAGFLAEHHLNGVLLHYGTV